MRVARLEVFGFKSFMERLVLPLESGMTGVVGPNGCGKSNIVDALRWILGETRASHLRGGTLEDVIFNGTDSLRPLGLAEVSITLRATGADIFSELGSAEAVAAVDEATDVDLPADTDTLEAPAVVEEGSVAVAESSTISTPAVAGPAPEEEGASHRPSLRRYEWLRGVHEVQLTRRLYRSGESEFFMNRVPCRLRDMKEFARIVGLGARSFSIVAQGEIHKIISAKPEERRTFIEEAAGVSGLREKIGAAERRLEETGANLTRIEDVLIEVRRQVNSLRRLASAAKNRQEIVARVRDLSLQVFSARAQEVLRSRSERERAVSTAQADEQNNAARLQRVEAEEGAARGALLGLDLRSDQLRTELEAIREKKNTFIRRREALVARRAEISGSLAARRQELAVLEQRSGTLTARQSDIRAEIERLAEREGSVATELEPLVAKGDSEVREAAASVAALREAIGQLEREARASHDTFVRLDAAARALETKQVAESSSAFRQEIAPAAKIVAELVRVAPEHQRAVEAVLGERAGFLVVEDVLALASRLTALPRRGSVGVISSQTSAVVGSTDAALFRSPFPRLSELVTADEGCQGLIVHLFAGVVVAPSLEEAQRAFSSGELEGSALVVTPAGELLSPQFASRAAHEEGLVAREHQRRQLLAERDAAQIRRDALQAQVAEQRKSLQGAEEIQRRALADAEERNRRIRKLQEEGAVTRATLTSHRQQMAHLELDLRQATQRHESVGRDLSRYEQELAAVESESQSQQGEEEITLLQREEVLQGELKLSETERRAGYATLEAHSRELHEVRRAVERAQAAAHAATYQLERLSLESEGILQEARQLDPEATLEGLSELRSGDLLERCQAEEELQKLRARIAREGDVDPTSIDRCAEEESRLSELEQQRSDLMSAVGTLRSSIEQLTVTAKERFVAVFSDVQKRFELLVPRLFGGGKGEIRLTNPETPLETGIEIIARPPGKKLSSIELLSGGEKALTATALMVALFGVRPGPLCVLDEVDAPLDEANVVRFLSLLREMSAQTQFMMITHNKQSMSVCDRLIGVTMEQPGASRVITVSLQEAYKAVA